MASSHDPKGKGKARAFPLEELSIQESAFVNSSQPQPSSSKVLLRASLQPPVCEPSYPSSAATSIFESVMFTPLAPFVNPSPPRPPSPGQTVIDISHVDEPDVPYQSLDAAFNPVPIRENFSAPSSSTATAARPATDGLASTPPVTPASPIGLDRDDDLMDAVPASEADSQPAQCYAKPKHAEKVPQKSSQADEEDRLRTEPLQASAETLSGRKIAGLPKKFASMANRLVTPPQHIDHPPAMQYQFFSVAFSQPVPCGENMAEPLASSSSSSAACPATVGLVWVPPITPTSSAVQDMDDDFVDAALASEVNPQQPQHCAEAMPRDLEEFAKVLEDQMEREEEGPQNSPKVDEGERLRTEPLQASAETLKGRRIARLPKKAAAAAKSPVHVDAVPTAKTTLDDNMGEHSQSDSFPSPLHQRNKPLEDEEVIPAFLRDGRKLRGLPRRGGKQSLSCLSANQIGPLPSPPASAAAPSPTIPDVADVAEAPIIPITPRWSRVKKVNLAPILPIPQPVFASSIDMLQVPRPDVEMNVETAPSPLSVFPPPTPPQSPFVQLTPDHVDPTTIFPPHSSPPPDVPMAHTLEVLSDALFPEESQPIMDMHVDILESTNSTRQPDVAMSPSAETPTHVEHPETTYHCTMGLDTDNIDSEMAHIPSMPDILMTPPTAEATSSVLVSEEQDTPMDHTVPKTAAAPLYAYRSQPPVLPPSVLSAASIMEVDDIQVEDNGRPDPCTPEFDEEMAQLSIAMEAMHLHADDVPDEAIHYIPVPMDSGPTEDEVIDIFPLADPVGFPEDIAPRSEDAPPAAAGIVTQDPAEPRSTSPSPDPTAASSATLPENLSQVSSTPEVISGQGNKPPAPPIVTPTPTPTFPASTTTDASTPTTPPIVGPDSPNLNILISLALQKELGMISLGLPEDEDITSVFCDLLKYFTARGHPLWSPPGIKAVRTASGMAAELLNMNGYFYDLSTSKWHFSPEVANVSSQSASPTTSSPPDLTTSSDSASDSSFDTPWDHNIEGGRSGSLAKDKGHDSLGLQL